VSIVEKDRENPVTLAGGYTKRVEDTGIKEKLTIENPKPGFAKSKPRLR